MLIPATNKLTKFSYGIILDECPKIYTWIDNTRKMQMAFASGYYSTYFPQLLSTAKNNVMLINYVNTCNK